MGHVIIKAAGLDELPTGEIILRGVLDLSTLDNIMVAGYQREVLSGVKIDKLVRALRESTVPDIELSMRGEQFRETDSGVILIDGVYVVDGLQRISAAKKLLSNDPRAIAHIGVVVHFGRDEKWERDRFRVLNLTQTKLSPNVTLRNLSEENPAVDRLYKLSQTNTFALHRRISWQQNMPRHCLLTATVYVKTVGMLHSHIGPGRQNNVVQLSAGLEKIMANIGVQKFTGNTREFFHIIDAAWGIERIAYRSTAVHVKQTFLMALAKVFAEHENFWNNDRLNVDATTIRKLQSFPMSDPSVIQTAGATGKAIDLMFGMIVEHINAGRRTRRLVRRNYFEGLDIQNEME